MINKNANAVVKNKIKFLQKEITLLDKLENYFLEGNELCDKIIYSVMSHRLRGNDMMIEIKKLITNGELQAAEMKMSKVTYMIEHLREDLLKTIEKFIYNSDE